MKSYFSNQVYCTICSGTNREFWMCRNTYKGEVKYYRSKKCLECARELQRKKRREHQRKEKFKEWRKNYIKNNLEKVKASWAKSSKQFYKREKAKRKLLKLQESMIGKTII